MQEKFNQNYFSLNIGKFASGIYFYRLSDSRDVLATGQLLNIRRP